MADGGNSFNFVNPLMGERVGFRKTESFESKRYENLIKKVVGLTEKYRDGEYGIAEREFDEDGFPIQTESEKKYSKLVEKEIKKAGFTLTQEFLTRVIDDAFDIVTDEDSVDLEPLEDAEGITVKRFIRARTLSDLTPEELEAERIAIARTMIFGDERDFTEGYLIGREQEFDGGDEGEEEVEEDN